MSQTPAISELDLLSGLPGEAMIRKGLSDRQSDRLTVESCLVEIADPRLKRAGVMPGRKAAVDAERTLYQLLSESSGDAYSRYNSLLRELASFERGLDHRIQLNRPQ